MKTVITEFDCKMLIRCIENNPIGVRYCFDGGLYTVSVKDVKAMQNEFISKVPLIMTAPETLSFDDYTNLRLYVTDEFTGPGWNNEKLEPTEYGIELDLLLNKLSALAEVVEKEKIETFFR